MQPSYWDNALEILQCPKSKTPLHFSAAGDSLVSEDLNFTYPVLCNIPCFATVSADESARDIAQSVRDYYASMGWQRNNNGQFDDTRAFVDARSIPIEYTRKCIKRLNKHFDSGGRFLVDAGSGPITHPEYLGYSAKFDYRVCIDLSLPALHIARSKLASKCIALQGDLTSLPIKTGAVDAVTCNHVLYHIPAEKQAAALLELWRILRPGGVAVVVYAWPRAPIAGALRRLARIILGDPRRDASVAKPDIYFAAHSLSWFRSQAWPFRYSIDTYRIVGNDFMRDFIRDGWVGRLTLQGFYALQIILPNFCGKYGAYPAILLFKD